MRRWYEELFANYAKTYDTESFTAGTSGEVDFLEKELEYDKTKSILDIGCGTGRHAIELAKRGYSVTGIDLSASQLARAGQKAKEAGVRINFLQLNACSLPFKNEFDFAIMLCEGGFSLQETDALNFQILEGAERALRSPGRLIFSTLNALFPLYHKNKLYLSVCDSTFRAAVLLRGQHGSRRRADGRNHPGEQLPERPRRNGPGDADERGGLGRLPGSRERRAMPHCLDIRDAFHRRHLQL